MTDFINPEDYVTHNNFNTISIDSFGISLYQKYINNDFDEDEVDEFGDPIKSVEDLDKDLIELLKNYIDGLNNTVIVIERSIKL